MNRKIAFLFLLCVPSLLLAKSPFDEVKNKIKKDEYTREKELAFADFKRAGIAAGVVVGTTAFYALLMKGFGLAHQPFMGQKIGDLPLVTWTFYVLAILDAAGIAYSGYKSVHGIKHVILAQYKKSLKNGVLQYE